MSIFSIFDRKPKEPTIELVNFTYTDVVGFAGPPMYKYTLTLKVNGKKSKVSKETDRNFTQLNFKNMFSEALGTGETMFNAKSRYKIIISNKFKSSYGYKFF